MIYPTVIGISPRRHKHFPSPDHLNVLLRICMAKKANSHACDVCGAAHPRTQLHSAAATATALHFLSQSATTIVGLFGSVLGVDVTADNAVSPASHTIVGQVNVRYFTDGGGKVSDKAATAVDDSNFPPGADHFLSTIAREMCEKICTATFDTNFGDFSRFLQTAFGLY